MEPYRDLDYDQMSAIANATHEVDATHRAFGDTDTTLAAFDAHAPHLAAKGVAPHDLAAVRSQLAARPEQTLAMLKSGLANAQQQAPPAQIRSTTAAPRDQLAADEILKWEKSWPTAYDHGDGVPTIGVGHTRNVHMGDTATPEQIEGWLTEDLADTRARVAKAVKPEVLASLTDGQYAALISLAYNLKGQPLDKIAGTLVGHLNSGDLDRARSDFPLYKYSGHKVKQGLVNRRNDEMQLWDTGQVIPRR
jgi:lysozyme